MSDWKDQLKSLYTVLRDKQKAAKPDTSTKFDKEINFRGRAGYNDVGLPISPKTIAQKNKNKSIYAARAKAKYWAAGSQLRNINDRRKADAQLKHTGKEFRHDPKIPEPLEFKPAAMEPVTRSYVSSIPTPRKRIYNYYDPITVDDSVEVIPNRTEPKLIFKNKIEEEIYRLSKKK
jgi:hypothetical protein